MAGRSLFSGKMNCLEEMRIEIPGLPVLPGGTWQLVAVSEKGVKRQTLVKK
jgi:hypothetical protein